MKKTEQHIIKITKQAVDGIKCPSSERDVRFWDSELKGFFIRAYSTGRKVYGVRYRYGTLQRTYTIGKHGTLTPDEARTQARDILNDVAKGKDRAATKEEIKKAISVSELAKIYFATAPITNPNKRAQTWHDDERRIQNHILPQIGGMKVMNLTRLDAAKAINAIKEGKIKHKYKSDNLRGVVDIKGGEGAARRTLATARAMFNWGIIHCGIDINPFRNMNLGTQKTRERFLSHEEANSLIEAINQLEKEKRIPNPVADAIRMLLLTGARKSEITGLRWSEVDFARKHLHLPPERTKSGGKTGERFITLMPAAMEILSRRRIENENKGNEASIYVFPSERTGEPIINLSKPFNRILEKSGISALRIHDLRHSFASFAIADGASLYLVSKLLGHSNTRVTERYAHLSNDPLQSAVEKIGKRFTNANKDDETKSIQTTAEIIKPKSFEK